jgi:hypothetical protein
MGRKDPFFTQVLIPNIERMGEELKVRTLKYILKSEPKFCWGVLDPSYWIRSRVFQHI